MKPFTFLSIQWIRNFPLKKTVLQKVGFEDSLTITKVEKIELGEIIT